jgi:hypothetical protein
MYNSDGQKSKKIIILYLHVFCIHDTITASQAIDDSRNQQQSVQAVDGCCL